MAPWDGRYISLLKEGESRKLKALGPRMNKVSIVSVYMIWHRFNFMNLYGFT